MRIEKFEDLEIRKEARKLSIRVFAISSTGSFSKDFRFQSQIRSSSGSVMDNIAEGFGRSGNREFINFLSIAKGSNDEVRSQCYRAFDYKYIDKEELYELLLITEIISKKISAFTQYLKNSAIKGAKFDSP